MAKDEKTISQAAALVWREKGKDREILLVTSRDSRRWVPPKGHVEPKLSAAKSAELEAYEEAGVKGKIDDKPIGSYMSLKPLSKGGYHCRIQVFAMKLGKELKTWPEDGQRKRRWVAADKAADLVEELELKEILNTWAARIRG